MVDSRWFVDNGYGSADTFRRLVQSGQLPGYRLGERRRGALRDTRRIRVRRADVEALMEPVRTMGGTR